MMTQGSSGIGRLMGSTCRVLLNVLILGFLTWGFSANLVAQAAAGSATDAIKEMVDQVFAVIDDEALTAPDRAKERLTLLEDIVARRFDFEEMGKRTLGSHWRTLNAGQQKEFVRLFQHFLSGTYAGSIDGYVGGHVEYVKERRKGAFAEVQTKIVTKKLAVPVDYRLLQRSNTWRVYDVVIDGISLVKNYRGQFGRILKTDSFDTLLEKLQNKVAQP